MRIVITTLLAVTLVADATTAQSPGWYYGGPYAGEVQHLLSRVSGWKLPSCPTCRDFTVPAVTMNQNSQRDAYVAKAVVAAWATEAQAKNGNRELAESNAGLVRENLDAANALCSSTRTLPDPGSGPATLNIWGCPPPVVGSIGPASTETTERRDPEGVSASQVRTEMTPAEQSAFQAAKTAAADGRSVDVRSAISILEQATLDPKIIGDVKALIGRELYLRCTKYRQDDSNAGTCFRNSLELFQQGDALSPQISVKYAMGMAAWGLARVTLIRAIDTQNCTAARDGQELLAYAYRMLVEGASSVPGSTLSEQVRGFMPAAEGEENRLCAVR